VPLNTFFLGLGVIIDRESGAQRELLAAPVSRGLLVLGNLVVALAITALQVATLIGFAVARRIHFDVQGLRMLWFVGAALGRKTGEAFLEGPKKAMELQEAGQSGPNAELLELNRTSRGVLLQTLTSLVVLLIILDMIWKPWA
jgi:hypothetical protein